MHGHVCITCASFADSGGTCAKCGETLLDTRRDDVRELCADIDARRRRAREQTILWGAVAAAMALVGVLWCIPGFWELRRHLFALPFLIDQIALMAVLATVLLKVGNRVFAARPRFPSLTP